MSALRLLQVAFVLLLLAASRPSGADEVPQWEPVRGVGVAAGLSNLGQRHIQPPLTLPDNSRQQVLSSLSPILVTGRSLRGPRVTLYGGLHTAPTYLYLVFYDRQSDDESAQASGLPLVMGDLSCRFQVGGVRMGPFLSAGLLAAEGGLSVTWPAPEDSSVRRRGTATELRALYLPVSGFQLAFARTWGRGA